MLLVGSKHLQAWAFSTSELQDKTDLDLLFAQDYDGTFQTRFCPWESPEKGKTGLGWTKQYQQELFSVSTWFANIT